MKTTRLDISTNSSGKNNQEIELSHNILYGVVVSNEDENEMGRLRVRVRGLDDKYNIPDEELPFCYPLISKLFHVIPKKNEVVKVLISDLKRPYSLRHWIGPVISQPQFYSFENKLTAESSTEYGISNPDIAPNSFEKSKGIYPTINEVALIGRDNNDILLRDKEVILRAGKHLVDDKLTLNRKNPAYFNLKITPDGETSTAILGADKIGIITHKGKKKYNPILDQDEINRFFETAHPLLKGDLTIEVLKKIINAIIFHVHGGAGLPPTNTNPINDLLSINLPNLISENIKIN